MADSSFHSVGEKILNKINLTMRLKPNLQLRKIGSHHMIVDSGDTVNLTNVYTLNATASRMWKLAEGREFTAEMLATMLCEEYAVDKAIVLEDVKRQLDEWITYGLILP